MSKLSGTMKKRLFAVAAVVVGCNLALFPSCETVATTVNPCGSIFGFCDPTDVDRLFADIPDWDLDPSCSVPYYGLDGGGVGGGGAQGLGVCSPTPVYPFTPGPRPE